MDTACHGRKSDPQGRRRGDKGAIPHIRELSEFFNGKWLCWDVGPALFNKVTNFSLPPEVLFGQRRAQVLRAMTIKETNGKRY